MLRWVHIIEIVMRKVIKVNNLFPMSNCIQACCFESYYLLLKVFLHQYLHTRDNGIM